MKYKFLIQGGILMALMLVITFSAGQAYASTGCFNDTNGHWAETFICWMKDNGITAGTGNGNYSPENPVTRAEMAVFMQKLADIPPANGDLTISDSGQNWDVNNDVPTVKVTHNFAYNEFLSTTATSYGIYSTMPIPTRLYNTNTYLDGMQICYQGIDGAYIDSTALVYFDGTTDKYTSFTDITDRFYYGVECFKLALPAPAALTEDDFFELYILIKSPGANLSIRIVSGALYLHIGDTINSALDPAQNSFTIMNESSELP